MPILSKATTHDLVNLLDMFPAKTMKEHWPEIKGTKEKMCQQIATEKKSADIVDFVGKYFSRCKLHVHIFSHNAEIKECPPPGPAVGERVREVKDRGSGSALYLYWAEYEGVLTEPEYLKVKKRFLWPIRFEFDKKTMRITMVVMEKNLSAHFEDRELIGAKKLTEEEDLLASLMSGLEVTLPPTDIHKGIKQLWQDDLIDCIRVRYKNPFSTDSSTMDEEAGIREKNSTLYKTLLKCPLLSAQFKVKTKEFSDISIFSVEPANGYVGFPRYTADEGDTDNVVREILRLN